MPNGISAPIPGRAVVSAMRYDVEWGEPMSRSVSAYLIEWKTGGVATIVIVHGGFGGGWEWTSVAERLRARGHRVFTPTLTGMGERSHLGRDEVVRLATHVQDVVAVLEYEDLHEVVLCAASYGGVPVTGAADAAPGRIGQVVYIDALVPVDGQSALDLLPEAFADMVGDGVAEHGDGWRMPIPPALLLALLPIGSLPEEQRARYVARVCAQPAMTFAEPIRLTGAIDDMRRVFIRCTAGEHSDELGGDPIEACASLARAEGWAYLELSSPHDPQVFEPAAIAALLDELAGHCAEPNHAARS